MLERKDTKKEQIQALYEEFKALRAEIGQRSTAQLAIIQVNVTAIGLVFGAALSKIPDPDGRILFVIPIISPMLGLLFLDHDHAIGNIGIFIQTKIKPQVHRLLGTDLPDWETFVRDLELRRMERLSLLGIPVVVLFLILPAAALATPFLLNRLVAMKQDLLLFGAPGIAFLLFFLVYWLNFAWVRRRIHQRA